MRNEIKDSFVITLTYNGKPVIFRLLTTEGHNGTYEVTALNDKDFSPFLMQQVGSAWLITTGVPPEMEALQSRISALINAYREGQGL